jgi:hypothetical protein
VTISQSSHGLTVLTGLSMGENRQRIVVSDMKRVLVVSILIMGSFVTSVVAQESSAAQKFEVTLQAGGQINGGYDLSISLLNRLEVANGVNYGITTGYVPAR